MLLSIIIPIYNAENFINKILDSILIRNFKDYEIILIMMVQMIKVKIYVMNIVKNMVI